MTARNLHVDRKFAETPRRIISLEYVWFFLLKKRLIPQGVSPHLLSIVPPCKPFSIFCMKPRKTVGRNPEIQAKFPEITPRHSCFNFSFAILTLASH